MSPKPRIGGFRAKDYPNHVLSGVLRVTFRRAAAATPGGSSGWLRRHRRRLQQLPWCLAVARTYRRLGDRLGITEAGIPALGSWEPLPTGPGLIDHWRGRLGKAERLILETLTQVYPDPLTKEEVAAKAGYEANGGGFNNALGRLRTLELVQGRGKLRANDTLFDTTA